MGWYGGQHGSMRLHFREKTSTASSRLRSALPSSVSLVGFGLRDNSDSDYGKSLVNNPLSQDELTAKINAEQASGDLALYIHLASHRLEWCYRFRPNQERLDLFGNPNLPKEAIIAFLTRCPSLEALLLAYDTEEAFFVQSIFQANLLPKLCFLEVSEANDHAVAAMVSAPNLQQLIIREDGWSLTNEGFGRLVETGGGQVLQAVTLGLVKSRPLCKTVTKNYLIAIRSPSFALEMAGTVICRTWSWAKKCERRPKPI
jgi:hypothetical protein